MNGGGVSVVPTAAPQWVQVSFTIPPRSATWDPTNLNQFGVQLYTVGAPGGIDGGTTDGGTTDAGAGGITVAAVDDVVVQ